MNEIIYTCEILKAFEIEPKPLDVIAADYFRRHKSIGSRLRKNISEMVYGVTRMRRRIDGYLSMMGKKRITVADRVDFYSSAMSGAIKEVAGIAVSLSPSAKSPEKFPAGDAAFFSMPDFLYDMMVKDLGRLGANSLAMAMNVQSDPVIRVNLRISSREDVIASLKSEGIDAIACTHSPFGVRLFKRAELNNLKIFKAGAFEIQDEGSQLLSILSLPSGDGAVLDLCAGGGGKSLAISSMSKARLRIVATDADPKRLSRMNERIVRSKAKNIEVVPMKTLIDDEKYLAAFDLSLIHI